MPPEEKAIVAEPVPIEDIKESRENPFNETVQAHMLQIMGQQQYVPTQTQVDKILQL